MAALTTKERRLIRETEGSIRERSLWTYEMTEIENEEEETIKAHLSWLARMHATTQGTKTGICVVLLTTERISPTSWRKLAEHFAQRVGLQFQMCARVYPYGGLNRSYFSNQKLSVEVYQ